MKWWGPFRGRRTTGRLAGLSRLSIGSSLHVGEFAHFIIWANLLFLELFLELPNIFTPGAYGLIVFFSPITAQFCPLQSLGTASRLAGLVGRWDIPRLGITASRVWKTSQDRGEISQWHLLVSCSSDCGIVCDDRQVEATTQWDAKNNISKSIDSRLLMI